MGRGQRQLLIGDRFTGKARICITSVVNQTRMNFLKSTDIVPYIISILALVHILSLHQVDVGSSNPLVGVKESISFYIRLYYMIYYIM